MRNLKKVLSLVLCMAMMLSIMVVGAGAAFKDQEKIVNDEAVDMCVALNIINGYTDGSYKPEGNITRAEMCKMICVALNGGKEPATATKVTPTYTDIKGHWAEGYIEYCSTKGIVAGVGGGKFNPNGNVTGSQAAKMLLIALGYNADVEKYVGASWELKVNVQANQDGLYKDLEKIDPSVALTRDNAAQMIWNALNAYVINKSSSIDRVTGDIVDIYEKSETVDLLEKAYQAKTLTGTFNGNYDTGASGKAGYIDVAGYDFPYDFDLSYIGEEVKVIYKDGVNSVGNGPDSKDTIYGVYVTGETTVYNIVKDDIQKVTATKVKFDDVEHEYVGGTIVFNYGAKAAQALNQTNLTALKVASGDTIKFVTNTNGKINGAYVVESNMAKVSAINSSKVTLSNVGAISLADNDIYKGIAKDDVVVVTQLYKTTKDDATFVVTKAETVNGTVKSFAGYEKVNVDGTTYYLDATELTANKMAKLTDNAIEAFANSNLEDTATLYLINGFVGAADSEAADTSYALVTAAYNMDRIGSAIGGAQLQLLTIDGKTIYDVDDGTVTKTALTTYNDNTIVGKMVEFSKASDSSVEIKTVVTTSVSVADNGVVYDKDTKSLTVTGGTRIVDSDAVLFTSTSATGDYKAYNLRSLGDIANKTGNAEDLYYATKDNKVIAAFIDLESKPSGASSTTLYGMVTAYERNVKVDDVYYDKLTVWTGEETVVYTKDTGISKGAFVYFDQTSDNLYAAGEIKTLGGTDALVVEYEENDKVLNYKTSLGGSETAKAVDNDVKIVYVNVADKKAGDEIGVNKYDQVTGYANVKFADIDSDGKIDVIIVDSNYDILDQAATATYAVNVSTANIAATAVSPAYTVTATSGPLVKDSTVTVTITPASAVAAGTDTITISCTGNSDQTLTFDSGDGTTAKTVTFTMPAAAATIEAVVSHADP